MIKRFVYIVLILVSAPILLSAKVKIKPYLTVYNRHDFYFEAARAGFIDTLALKKRQQELEEKRKIKEIAKAKRHPKPEKVDEDGNSIPEQVKAKPKRQRRPTGLERPPEIPRRNGN